MMGEYSPDWISGKRISRERKERAVHFLLEYNDLEGDFPLIAFTPRYMSRTKGEREREEKGEEREREREEKGEERGRGEEREGRGERERKGKKAKEEKDEVKPLKGEKGRGGRRESDQGPRKRPKKSEGAKNSDDQKEEEHLDMQLEFLQNWHKYKSPDTCPPGFLDTAETPNSEGGGAEGADPAQGPRESAACDPPAESGTSPRKLARPFPAALTKEKGKEKRESGKEVRGPCDLESLLTKDEDPGLGRLLGVHQNDLEYLGNKVYAMEKLKNLHVIDREKGKEGDKEREKEKDNEELGELLGVHKIELEAIESKVDARERLKSLGERREGGGGKKREKEGRGEDDLSKILGVEPNDFGKFMEETKISSTFILFS
jgi:hypothetical protein